MASGDEDGARHPSSLPAKAPPVRLSTCCFGALGLVEDYRAVPLAELVTSVGMFAAEHSAGTP